MQGDAHRLTVNRKNFQQSFNKIYETEVRHWISQVFKEANLPTLFEGEKEFGDVLRDGTVLCCLLEIVEPEKKVKYNKKPKFPATKNENIQLFIDSCRLMNVKASFVCSDLYESKAIPKVIACIRELGLSYTKRGFKPPLIEALTPEGEKVSMAKIFDSNPSSSVKFVKRKKRPTKGTLDPPIPKEHAFPTGTSDDSLGISESIQEESVCALSVEKKLESPRTEEPTHITIEIESDLDVHDIVITEEKIVKEEQEEEPRTETPDLLSEMLRMMEETSDDGEECGDYESKDNIAVKEEKESKVAQEKEKEKEIAPHSEKNDDKIEEHALKEIKEETLPNEEPKEEVVTNKEKKKEKEEKEEEKEKEEVEEVEEVEKEEGVEEVEEELTKEEVNAIVVSEWKEEEKAEKEGSALGPNASLTVSGEGEIVRERRATNSWQGSAKNPTRSPFMLNRKMLGSSRAEFPPSCLPPSLDEKSEDSSDEIYDESYDSSEDFAGPEQWDNKDRIDSISRFLTDDFPSEDEDTDDQVEGIEGVEGVEEEDRKKQVWNEKIQIETSASDFQIGDEDMVPRHVYMKLLDAFKEMEFQLKDKTAKLEAKTEYIAELETKTLLFSPRTKQKMKNKKAPLPMDLVEERKEQHKKLSEMKVKQRKEQSAIRRELLTEKTQIQRLSVLEEILYTEKTYLQNLQVLIRARFVLLEAKVISHEEAGTIFLNVEILYAIHQNISEELSARFSGTEDSKCWDISIGDILLKIADALRDYIDYVNNQESQSKTVQLCSSRKQFSRVLFRQIAEFDTCEFVMDHLFSFLITPIQRMCKYPLLLRELIKSTADDHGDSTTLELALERIQEATMEVNEKKKDFERNINMMYVKERLEGIPRGFNLTTPTRYFIREGDMSKISKGKSQERKFFLFDDVILYGSKGVLKSGKIQMKGKIPLNLLLVNNLPDNDQQHLKNAFELIRLDHKKKKYIICAKDLAQKQLWMKDIGDRVSHFLNEEVSQRKEYKTNQERTSLSEKEEVAPIASESDVPQ